MPRPTKPGSGVSPISSAPDPPAGDVAERVPREDSAAHDGEDPGHGGDDGDDGADRGRDVDLRAGEEPRLEDGRVQLVHHRSARPGSRAGCCLMRGSRVLVRIEGASDTGS